MNGIHARSSRPRSDATTDVVTSSKRLDGCSMSATASGSSIDVASPEKRELWTGRVFTALAALMLFFSASMKLSHAPQVVEMFTGKFGFEESALIPIGILEIVTVLYLIPRTAVLGAILIAAYLGGAVVTHLRVGDPFVMPALLGVLAWGGLFLRDTRLRALLPLRR